MQVSKLTPVVIAAGIMTFISLFPFLNLINLLCCAGIIGGGYAGAAYYAKQLSNSGGKIEFKDGAMIGILSGLLSAMIVVVFTTLITIISSQNPVPEMQKILDSYGLPIPPEYDSILKKISDEYDRNGFSITITLVNLAAYLITYPLFGGIGGVIAASVYGKRKESSDN
jgi:hypothetical protein